MIAIDRRRRKRLPATGFEASQTEGTDGTLPSSDAALPPAAGSRINAHPSRRHTVRKETRGGLVLPNNTPASRHQKPRPTPGLLRSVPRSLVAHHAANDHRCSACHETQQGDQKHPHALNQQQSNSVHNTPPTTRKLVTPCSLGNWRCVKLTAPSYNTPDASNISSTSRVSPSII